MKRSFSPTGAALLAASVLLAACNNDTGSTPLPGGEDEHDHGAETAGRLVFTHADGSNSRVYVHDLESRSTLADFALVHPATAVHSSPEQRYAVIVQRDNDQVEFLDGGVYRHDDHVDEGDPAMLPFTLSGVRPTHYRHHGEQAALFFDGDSASAALSQFHLFSDESLESGGTLAHQTLDTAHHGIAEPLDGVVLASQAAASGDAPDGISVFELHGDHFDDAKIPVAERLATVVGHPDVAEFAAFSYPGGNLYALDPEASTATQVDWRDGAVDGAGDPVSPLAQGFD
ncbi:MAG TPA: hypothetical protein DD399_06625, partial [Alcanivorax sp.]|nr:hypothetical protein [Alcanivorax sp.]